MLIPIWLVLAFVIGAVFALLLSFVDEQPSTFGDTVRAMWHGGLGILYIQTGDGNLAIEILTFLLGFVTLFIAPVVAGLVIIAAMKRVGMLVSGRSAVLEEGHTVVLGWSDQVYAVIAGLVDANKSRGRAAIAVLADKPQVEMQDLIEGHVGDTGSTRVICRTGNPIDINDLQVVSLDSARSIISLAPEGPGADTQTIKTLLAVTNSPNRSKTPYNVVASVSDSRNHAVAQIAGGAETIVVDADDISAKLVVLTARQSGLSAVYMELLDFAGDEIYIVKEPALAGKTFGEALQAFGTSSVLGLMGADGTVRLKPPMETAIAPTDQLIVLASDETAVRLGQKAPAIVEQAIAPTRVTPAAPVKTLVLGWNRRAKSILRNLDSYGDPQSTVHVVAGAGTADAIGALISGASWTNVTASSAAGDTSDREVLEGLDVGSYDHVIVLASDDMAVQETDARTLVTLLNLRDIHDKKGQPGRGYSIVSEMLDERSRQLGQLTQADDFVISPKLTSLLLTQLSENRHLAGVFADLMGPAGAEIYLKPAEDYVLAGQAVDFHTVVEAARRRGEVAIGYRIKERASQPPAFGVVLNPNKKDKVTFKTGDRIVVLADG